MPIDLKQFESAVRGIRAPRTAASYVRIAAAFLATVDADFEPARSQVERFLERSAFDGYRRAPSTRNQELAALRALAGFAQREGIWQHDPTLGIEFAKVPMRNAVFLTAPELRRLFVAAGKAHTPNERARNIALLALMSQAGLRVHEVVGLNLTQIDLQQETIIGIRGKGGTEADIPVSPEVVVIISRWLERRPLIARLSETALFVSRLGSRISTRSVERAVETLRKAAGISKPASCHTLRHSMATLSLELGADVVTISEILRHHSIATTQRYLHCLDGRRRDTVRRLASTIPTEVLQGLPEPASSSPGSENGFENPIDVHGVFGDVWDDAA